MDSFDAPPPYFDPSLSKYPSHSSTASHLLRLPTHLLLQLLSHCSLSTLVFTLKPVCRTLHLAVCAVTRGRRDSRFKWENGILKASGRNRLPSTGVLDDRLPRGREGSGGGSVMKTRTREEEVYDCFIASLARIERDRYESVLLVDGGEEVEDESSLSFEKDLFRLLQPKARVEDLLIERGRQEGWIESTTSDGMEGKGSLTFSSSKVRAEDIKVELKLRSAKLLLPVLGSGLRPVWKGIVEVNRSEGDSLEAVATRLESEFRRCAVRRIEGIDRDTVSYQF